MHGDHEGAAVLQPLAVVGLAYDVREVEERANVLNPPMGDGGATHEDLVRVRVRLRLMMRAEVILTRILTLTLALIPAPNPNHSHPRAPARR